LGSSLRISRPLDWDAEREKRPHHTLVDRRRSAENQDALRGPGGQGTSSQPSLHEPESGMAEANAHGTLHPERILPKTLDLSVRPSHSHDRKTKFLQGTKLGTGFCFAPLPINR
jgi:hypothetical protein